MTQAKKKIKLSSAIERFLYAKVQKADWDDVARNHIRKIQTTRSAKVCSEAQKAWDKANHRSTFWFVSAEYWGKKAGIVSASAQLRLIW